MSLIHWDEYKWIELDADLNNFKECIMKQEEYDALPSWRERVRIDVGYYRWDTMQLDEPHVIYVEQVGKEIARAWDWYDWATSSSISHVYKVLIEG